MKNLITCITSMSKEYKVNTRLDMLTKDGHNEHIHMANYFTKYRDEIFHMQKSWMQNQAVLKN